MKVKIPGLRPDQDLVINTEDFSAICLSAVVEEVGIDDGWVGREAGARTITIRLNDGANWYWEPVKGA